MEILLVALIFLVLGLLVISLFRNSSNKAVQQLREEINDLKAKQLEATNKSLVDQTHFFQSSQMTLTQVHEKLGSLEKSSQQMAEIGKDIGQLQDILKSPKLRGGIGEYLLEDLLRQVLPEQNYQMQYRFKDGTFVDAIIKVGERLVPIDAKFPIENFRRILESKDEQERDRERKEFAKNVKKKIEDIAEKYIKEYENTYDFAMMYIPAENIYYEIIITDDLKDKKYDIATFAMERKVIPVSPNSLYSYLMAIVLGLKGYKIEQQTKIIMNELSKIQSNYSKFYEDFTLLGKHLKNASGKYDDTILQAERFNDKLENITGVNQILIEKKGHK